MKRKCQQRWFVFWLCLTLTLSWIPLSYSAIVDLIAFVSYSIKDSGGTPLADGSIVAIFGSADAVNNGPRNFGVGLVWNSVQGDDVFLGYVRIDAPSYGGSNGTFYTANEFTFDDSTISYLYLRFFNTTNYPVMGYTQWNTSTLFGFTSDFGKVTVDFVGNYLTSVTNNFIQIPEPSTSHLLLLFFGLVFGMRASMKKNERNQRKDHRG